MQYIGSIQMKSEVGCILANFLAIKKDIFCWITFKI